MKFYAIRRALFAMPLLLAVFAVGAQTTTVTIGTDTTSTTGIDDWGPYNQHSPAHRVQLFYTAQELIANGATAGNITGLAFFCTSPPQSALISWTIRMSHTTATSLANGAIATPVFLTVSTQAAFTPVDDNWNQHAFMIPFNWNGLSNIIIDVCSEAFPNASTGTNSFTYTDSIYCRYIGEPLACGSPTSSPSHERANLQLMFTTCSGIPAVGTISGPASVDSTTNFTLLLPPVGPGVIYQWQSSLDSIAWTDLTGATATSYAGSQTTSTYYRVIATCSNASLSDTTNAFQVLIQSPGCIPTVGTISGPTSVSSNVNFSLSIPPAGPAITYQWQSSSDGVAWTDLAGVTASSYNGSQATTMYYRVIAMCANSGLSDTTNAFQVVVQSTGCNPTFTYAQDSASHVVQFVSNTSGSGLYTWVIDVLDTVYGTNPTFDFFYDGLFSVCLTYEDTVNGCTDTDCELVFVQQPQTPAPPSAFITGTVYLDANQNGSMDTGEQGIGSQVVMVNGIYAFTDWNGFYEVEVPLNSYVVSYTVPSGWASAWATTGNSTLAVNATVDGSIYGGNNFGVYIDSAFNDVGISAWFFNPTPGFHKNVSYIIYNAGVTSQDVQLDIDYDNHLVFDQATNSGWISLDTVNHHVSYQFTIPPLDTFYFSPLYYCPVGVPIGTSVFDTAVITPLGFTDAVASNNTAITQATTVGSFDPNEKSVNPAGVGINNSINPNHVDELTYTIQFQNTGTAPAQFVIIKDTLDDSSLDIASLKLLHYTHNCHVDITLGNVLTAYFDNIMLPDSNANEPESHGSFTFKIKLKPNLPDFTEVANKAYIYFDYNEPVITEPAFVTLDQHLSTKAFPGLNDFTIYPVPVDNALTIATGVDAKRRFELLDITGRILTTGYVKNQTTLDVSKLANGVYAVRLLDGVLITGSKKIVVTHPLR